MKAIKLYIFILFIINNISAYTQVSIGLGIAPEKAALLELKDQTAATPGGITATKGGLLLPKVLLQNRFELFPFFDSSLVGNVDYETIQKPSHKGLIVYNIGNADLSEGTYIWNGSEWRLFSDLDAIAPEVTTLLCGTATLEPQSFVAGNPFSGIMKVPYEGGNGGRYPSGSEITSIAGNLTIKAKLRAGILEYGFGYLIYDVYGTPSFSSPTGATFNITFGTNNPVSCQVTVGQVISANMTSIATMGPMIATTDNGVNGFARAITTPDGKFSLRVFAPISPSTTLGNSDIQIRNNTDGPVTIMWNSTVAYQGASDANASNALALITPKIWSGNTTENSDIQQLVTTSSTTGWGDVDVYFVAPEQRSYIWTTTDVVDKTAYILTFMMGAPNFNLTANVTNAAQTKVFMKIEQITTPD